MKKLIISLLIAVLAAMFISSTALAAIPPGQRGYEGQPGNQGGFQHAGLKGYEGQPGNQGGH